MVLNSSTVVDRDFIVVRLGLLVQKFCESTTTCDRMYPKYSNSFSTLVWVEANKAGEGRAKDDTAEVYGYLQNTLEEVLTFIVFGWKNTTELGPSKKRSTP